MKNFLSTNICLTSNYPKDLLLSDPANKSYW